jgi:hypothetical protein
MIRKDGIALLRGVRTVDEAAPILRALAAAELPHALLLIDRAIADGRTAHTPAEGLDRLAIAVQGIDPATGGDNLRGPLDDAGCALIASVGLHGGCSALKPCEVGRTASCPREHGRALRRAAQEMEWSAIELRQDAGDVCHYLDGRALHNGASIELQARESVCDADKTWYWRPLPDGVRVFFSAHWDAPPKKHDLKATLEMNHAGHIFSAPLLDEMRFRWPPHAAGGAG